jgi:ATP-dependent Lhr-like helicase
MLGDDLEAWLEESSIMRRAFRNCAIISGLIEKQLPGERRKTRSLTISSDLIYDVLRRYQPDHILLKAARADAAYEMLDLSRLNKTLERLSGHIIFKKLEKLSPLSIAMILEIGRETVYGDGVEALLAEAEAEYLAEALS